MLATRWGRMTHSAACGRCVQTDAASQFTKRATRAHLAAVLLGTLKAPGQRPAQPFSAPLVACDGWCMQTLGALAAPQGRLARLFARAPERKARHAEFGAWHAKHLNLAREPFGLAAKTNRFARKAFCFARRANSSAHRYRNGTLEALNSTHPLQDSAPALQRHGLRLSPAGRNRDVGVAGGAPCWRRAAQWRGGHARSACFVI